MLASDPIGNTMRPDAGDITFKTNDKCNRVHSVIIGETSLHLQILKLNFTAILWTISVIVHRFNLTTFQRMEEMLFICWSYWLHRTRGCSAFSFYSRL
jgi:hypothetical protein